MLIRIYRWLAERLPRDFVYLCFLRVVGYAFDYDNLETRTRISASQCGFYPGIAAGRVIPPFAVMDIRTVMLVWERKEVPQ